MADNNIQPVVQKHAKGINTDFNAVDQPQGTYRYAMNAVSETRRGDMMTISTEESNEEYFNFTIKRADGQGYVSIITIGTIYVDDNNHVIFGVNFEETYSVIALLNDNAEVTTIIDDETNNCLNFRHSNQINGTYRLRNGCEKTVYWVDTLNNTRTFNLTDNYYTPEFNDWIKLHQEWEDGGQVGPEPVRPDADDKYVCVKFDLIKEYDDIPVFVTASVEEGGELLSGSYNFSIQYVDENENPTEWITTTNPVPIFDSKRSGNYYNVEGSSYSPSTPDTANIFGTTETSKMIRLVFDNLDPNYKYYRVAVIEATAGTGEPTRALMSFNRLIDNKEFIVTGNLKEYTEMPVEEVLLSKPDIGPAVGIEQTEDRLLIANIQGQDKPYCQLQQFASKIKTNYVTKRVPAHDYFAEGNPKDPLTMWGTMSAMGGEVYALGVVYIFDDESESPAYHIPGRPSGANDLTTINESPTTEFLGPGDQPKWKVYDTADTNGKMAYYELDNYVYDPRDDCEQTADGYWGRDWEGNILEKTNIRHHRFPNRHTIPHSETGLANETYQSRLWLRVSRQVDGIDVLTYKIDYDYNPNSDLSTTLSDSKEGTIWANDWGSGTQFEEMIKLIDGRIVQSSITLSPTTGICLQGRRTTINNEVQANCNTCNPAESNLCVENTIWATIDNTSYGNKDDQLVLLGVKFSNLELPDGVKGCYFVRAERDNFNRTVLGKAYSGTSRSNGNYVAFAGLTNRPSTTPTSTVTDDYNYLLSPENLFLNKELEPTYVKVENQFTYDGLKPLGEPATTDHPECGRTEYVQDVAGESGGMFDKDGWDWQGAFNGIDFSPATVNPAETNHTVKDSVHLPPVNRKLNSGYTVPGTTTSAEKTIYNCTMDHPIQMVNYNVPYVWGSRRQGLDVNYVSLNTIRQVYPILDNIKYYKMHNNAFYQNIPIDSPEEEGTIFGFDTYISVLNPSTSMFQGLVGASRTWDFVVAGIIIVAAAVVSIASLGTLAVPMAAIAWVAVGLVIASALVKLTVAAVETFGKEYTETDLDELMDVGYTYGVSTPANDDYLTAAMDYSDGLYIESDINIGLREGVQLGATDFMRVPNYISAKAYMANKWLGNDQQALTRKNAADPGDAPDLQYDGGQGKMTYRGIPCCEVYKYNLDYSRMNKEKVFFALPATYNCCSECLEDFPNRIYYSEKSFREELSDSYGKFLPLNYVDIPGEHGEITNLFTRSNALYAHTSKAIWYIAQNIQERVTNDVVSLVGTGGFFEFPARKIQEDIVGSNGSTQRFATLKTKYGVFFVDDSIGKMHLLNFSGQTGTQVDEITNKGMSKWFRQNMPLQLADQIYRLESYQFPNTINPAGVNGIGYLSAMDYENNRIIVTKRDYLIKNEQTFHVVDKPRWRHGTDIGPCVALPTVATRLLNPADEITPAAYESPLYFNTADGNFYITYCIGGRMYVSLTTLDDETYFEDKSWTASYSFNTGGWTSFHSYLPRLFVYDHNNLYSAGPGLGAIRYKLWKHNIPDDYVRFYGIVRPHILEYVASNSPIQTGLVNDLILQTEAIKNDTEQRLITWNKAIFTNTRQCSGIVKLNILEQNLTTDYMTQSITNTSLQTNIKKRNKDWYINGLRDARHDYKNPIWLTDWESVKDYWPIDKVLNEATLGDKDWTELEPFRDKYIIIRLIFDDRNDIKLLTNYTVAMEQLTTQ